MEFAPEPFIKVRYVIDCEVAYDSFKGHTPDEIADKLEEEILDVVSELRSELLSVAITTTGLETINV